MGMGPRGEGVGRLGSNYARSVCPKVKEMGSFFLLQASELIVNISLKMGVNFAVSLNMDKNLC